jgi:hypothetical protein
MANKNKQQDPNSTAPRSTAKGTLLLIGGHEAKGNTEGRKQPDNFTGVDILQTFVSLIN